MMSVHCSSVPRPIKMRCFIVILAVCVFVSSGAAEDAPARQKRSYYDGGYGDDFNNYDNNNNGAFYDDFGDDYESHRGGGNFDYESRRGGSGRYDYENNYRYNQGYNPRSRIYQRVHTLNVRPRVHYVRQPLNVQTTLTKKVEASDPSQQAQADQNKNNVQMSLSYICNTKMQSKDKSGGYPEAREASPDGVYGAENVYAPNADYPPLILPSGGPGLPDYGPGPAPQQKTQIFIKRPKNAAAIVPPAQQHIGPKMDISCSGNKPNFL